MKLTLLGSGTCVNQLPNIPNRYPPAFLVEWADQKILFDCSEGTRFRLEQAGFNYTSIDHIAITHSHPDHCALVQFIQSKYVHYWWRSLDNEDLTIYCPKHIEKNFNNIWSFYNPDIEEMWKPIHFRAMSEPGSAEKIGNGTLKAYGVYHGHGKIDALAFRLETPEGVFTYSGDTGDCEGVHEACRGADIFVCEASSRINDQKGQVPYGHLAPQEVGEICKQGKVKKVILVHYQGFDTDEKMTEAVRSSGFEGEVVVGKDFQVIKT